MKGRGPTFSELKLEIIFEISSRMATTQFVEIDEKIETKKVILVTFHIPDILGHPETIYKM